MAAAKAPKGTFSGVIGILSRPWVQVLLIVLAGALAYSDTFHVPFLLDDETSITDNPVIRHLHSFLSGEGYSYGPNYNPRRFVGYLTLALNYHFGGLDVTGYHLVNVAIHLSSGLLVYALGRLILSTPFFTEELPAPTTLPLAPASLVPFFAALLFVTHPVQTQAVTYIVQRFASLCTMLYLASFVCYARARLLSEDRRVALSIPFYALFLVMALLAMWTKEIAATLPILVGAFEFSFFTRNRRKKLLVILPVLAVMAVIVPLGLMHSGKPFGEVLSDVNALTRETMTISRAQYLVTQFAVIVTYLRLLVLPIGQNLDYDYPVFHSVFQLRPFLSLLLLLSLMASSVWCFARSGRGGGRADGTDRLLRLVGFGIVWFFVSLGVESSVIPIRDVIFEHRLYLPCAGIFLAVAACLAIAVSRAPQIRPMAAVAAITLVVTLAAATFARNMVWESDISLWRDVTSKSPGRRRPHHNLARAYNQHGMLAEAEQEYLAALKIDPQNSESYTNLGVIYRAEGRLAEAFMMQQKAIIFGENNPSPRLNLGVLYASQQRYPQAEALFREALRLNPHYAEAHLDLALLYRLEGDLVRAEQEYRETIKLDPLNARAFDALGVICAKEGRPAEGEQFLRTAVSLAPNDPTFRVDLSRVVSSYRRR